MYQKPYIDIKIKIIYDSDSFSVTTYNIQNENILQWLMEVILLHIAKAQVF